MMKKAEIIGAYTRLGLFEILSHKGFEIAHLSALAEGKMSKISPRMRGISQMRTGAMYVRATSGRAENTYDAGACGADIYAVSARAKNHDTRAEILNLPREAPYPAHAAPKCDLVFSAPPHAKSMKFSRGARTGSRRRA